MKKLVLCQYDSAFLGVRILNATNEKSIDFERLWKAIRIVSKLDGTGECFPQKDKQLILPTLLEDIEVYMGEDDKMIETLINYYINKKHKVENKKRS